MAQPPPSAVAQILAPWLAHAREVIYGDLDDLATPDDLDEHLCISWPITSPNGDNDNDAWLWTLEAMELLDLYARVDYRGAWTWLSTALDIPAYIPLLDQLPTTIFPKHKIAWDAVRTGTDGRLLIAQDLVAARADERIRVALVLDLEKLAIGIDGVPTALSEVATLGMRAQEADPRSVFSLASIAVTTVGVVLTDAMLLRLSDIDRAGVRLSNLTIDRGVRSRDELSLSPTVAFLRSVFLPAANNPTELSVKTNMDTALFQAICSALAVTQCATNVRLTVPNAHAQSYWSWIAYALLSGDTANAIEWINLGVERLTPQVVDDVTRVLQAVELPDSFMREVLAACPGLERLKLTYFTVASFAWLTENDTGRLASVRLKHIESQDPQGYKPLVMALSDSERGIGRTLHELAIRDYVEDLEPWWPDLISMLSTNHQLERLLVRARISHGADEQLHAFGKLTQEIQGHNGHGHPLCSSH